MAMKLYSDVDIQNIANAIREKNGSSDTYKVSEMATAITNIPSGGNPGRLPSEYIEVEYIESTGTQYIDTLYIPNINTEMIIDFVDTNNSNYENYFGCDNAWRFQRNANQVGQFAWLVNNTTTNFNLDLTNRRRLYFSKNGIYDENGDVILNKVVTDINPAYSMLLFQGYYNNKIDNYGVFRLYSLYIYEDSNLIGEFVPCYRVEDNTVGLYDIVNGEFYVNKGTGTFLKGDDVVSKIEITSDGDYNVSDYELAQVNVTDNLKETLELNENGIFNVKQYGNVKVNVAGGEGWLPQPDWWDIDKILEDDTENYGGKVIALFADSELSSIISSGLRYTKCVTSDGVEYTNNNSNITHTWDTTKDKECSLGYKTRYIIFYYSTYNNNYFNGNLPNGCLYFIVKGFSNSKNGLNYNVGSIIHGNNELIEAYKYIDCVNMTIFFTQHTWNLRKIFMVNSTYEFQYVSFNGFRYFDFSSFDVTKITSFWTTSIFNTTNCPNLTFPYNNFPWDKTNNQQLFFQNCQVEIIDNIDFNNFSNVRQMFYGCTNLLTINNISNIKITGLDISSCSRINHDTLLRFLNALYDYSSEGGTYTITFGTTNLEKLTDDEKAIASNKGWTLN